MTFTIEYGGDSMKNKRQYKNIHIYKKKDFIN